jgi:hypothetical protein
LASAVLSTARQEGTAMTLGAVVAFVVIFGLPLWLVVEEVAHRTRSWRAAAEREAPSPEPRRAL